MFAHPGKKLNFMGNEIGQLREWDEKREQDWEILAYPVHDAFAHFIKALNQIYLFYPALSKLDCVRNGFSWIECSQEETCIYAFERRAEGQRVVAIFNFSNEEQLYTYKTANEQVYQLLIASDMECYGGQKKYEQAETFFRASEVTFKLSAFSGRYYLLEA